MSSRVVTASKTYRLILLIRDLPGRLMPAATADLLGEAITFSITVKRFRSFDKAAWILPPHAGDASAKRIVGTALAFYHTEMVMARCGVAR